jgi:hypothetical protein
MNRISELERFLSFIKSQMQSSGSGRGDQSGLVRCVTISRQSGCGARFFAEKLAADLQSRLPQGARPWTVFDRSLVEVVLRDHYLPARLASFMPEDKVGQLNDIIEDLFGLHPPTETLVRRTSETILRLAQLGHAIIVGRGGNVITARLPGMLHVRLVGSVEQRVTHLQQFDHLDKEDALKRMKQEDGGRRRYLKKYFNKDVDDPLLYHFVINTDWIALEDAVKMVGTFANNFTIPSRARNAASKPPLLVAN